MIKTNTMEQPRPAPPHPWLQQKKQRKVRAVTLRAARKAKRKRQLRYLHGSNKSRHYSTTKCRAA